MQAWIKIPSLQYQETEYQYKEIDSLKVFKLKKLLFLHLDLFIELSAESAKIFKKI